MISSIFAGAAKLLAGADRREKFRAADELLGKVGRGEIDLLQRDLDVKRVIEATQNSYDPLFEPHIGFLNRHYREKAFDTALGHYDGQIRKALETNDQGRQVSAELAKTSLLEGWDGTVSRRFHKHVDALKEVRVQTEEMAAKMGATQPRSRLHFFENIEASMAMKR